MFLPQAHLEGPPRPISALLRAPRLPPGSRRQPAHHTLPSLEVVQAVQKGHYGGTPSLRCTPSPAYRENWPVDKETDVFPPPAPGALTCALAIAPRPIPVGEDSI